MPRWTRAPGLRLDDAEVGRLGERLAEGWLRRRGMRPLARRVVTRGGELDLLLRDGATLVCVEVKTARRAHPLHPPGARLDAAGRARRRRALEALARQAGGHRPPPHRLDLVEVILAGPGGRASIVHHRDLRSPGAGAPGAPGA